MGEIRNILSGAMQDSLSIFFLGVRENLGIGKVSGSS